MPRQKRAGSSGGRAKLPPDVKVVRKTLADGSTKTFHYRRSTGQPILGQPGTVLFMESWAQAGEAAAGPLDGRDVRGLIARFKKAPENKVALPDSIRQRDRYLLDIEDRFGWMTWADVQDDEACQKFYDWRDEISDTPTQADRAVQTLNQLLKWAKKRKFIKVNQALDVDRLVVGPEALARRRGGLFFSRDDEAEILQHVRGCVHDAFQLALYTAMRAGDLCRLRWEMIDDEGWLRFTPSKTRRKTGVSVHLPTFALPPLAALLARLPRRPHGFILCGVTGGPLTPATLKHHWAADRDKYTKIRLHWHDIRGSLAQRLTEAGCTDAEIAAVTGHALTGGARGEHVERVMARSLGKYRSASELMALNAYAKWARAEYPDDAAVVPLRVR